MKKGALPLVVCLVIFMACAGCANLSGNIANLMPAPLTSSPPFSIKPTATYTPPIVTTPVYRAPTVPATTTQPVEYYPSPKETGQTSTGSIISLQIVSITTPVKPYSYATLKVKTNPGAICSIALYHGSTEGAAGGLGKKVADGNGDSSWTWGIGPDTERGSWRVVVTATFDDPEAERLAMQAASNAIARGADGSWVDDMIANSKPKLTSTAYFIVS